MFKIIFRLIPYKVKYYFFPRLISSNDFSNYLKKRGVKIGRGTFFFSPFNTFIDIQRSWMLTIGEYCKIAHGVSILNHDYSRSVLSTKYLKIIGEAKKTYIGNNVFIGVNSTILMGSKIGNNVIIGANSLISGIVPDNVVVAGNPFKIIRTIEEHLFLREKKLFKEAREFVDTFYSSFLRLPTQYEMGVFSLLFTDGITLKRDFKKYGITFNGDDHKSIIKSLEQNIPIFNSFKDFLAEISVGK